MAMGTGRGRLVFGLGLMLVFLSVSATYKEEERVNKSSSLGGFFWATGQDETDMLTADPMGDGADHLPGGFSSLEGMLQWAIGHSDPVKLKEEANDVQRLSANELKQRQAEIKELMQKLKMPSDADLMRIAIDDLNNSSISSEDRLRALNELLILVESLDNANDLDKLGGLVAVVWELSNSEPEIRTTSAWILGKASQNNVLVQNQILALGALTRLMKMVKSSYMEEAVKALHAVSALIRNNEKAQELFYSEDGDLLLQEIMSNSSTDVRLQKKAIFLVADLADQQLENKEGSPISTLLSSRVFLKSVVDLTASSDLDLQEKALLAIRSLLQLSSADALDFKDYCSLDRVLEIMREHLEKLAAQDEDIRDYARDMESLRRQVYIIFHRKLEEVSMVPT